MFTDINKNRHKRLWLYPPCAARTPWIHLQHNKWDAFYSNFNMNLHFCFTCKLSPRYTVHLLARTITINYQLYELKINVSIVASVSAVQATARSTTQWSSNVLPPRQLLTTMFSGDCSISPQPVMACADTKACECDYEHWTQQMSAAYLQHCSIFNKCCPWCTGTSSQYCLLRSPWTLMHYIGGKKK